MPNWCANVATITGPIDEVNRIADMARKGKFLESLVPTDEQPNVNVPGPGGAVFPPWYHWRLINWGTKWEVDCDSVEVIAFGDGTSKVTVEFDSAWEPPIKAYQAATENGLDVSAMYNEPGMTACGAYTSRYGEMSIEYGEQNSETVREFVGTVIDDHFQISSFLRECEEDC